MASLAAAEKARQEKLDETQKQAVKEIFAGEFTAAEEAIRQAEGLGAPTEWVQWRCGQIAFHPSRFNDAIGLLEPAGPSLPAETLAEAGTVLVPALAVDRAGVRLGRGAGFYDRALANRDPRARLIAVIRDDELLDAVPREPHDVPMTHALTPGGGLVQLGVG